MELVRNLLSLALLLELPVSNSFNTSFQTASRNANYVVTNDTDNYEHLDFYNGANQGSFDGARQDTRQDTRDDAPQDARDDARQDTRDDALDTRDDALQEKRQDIPQDTPQDTRDDAPHDALQDTLDDAHQDTRQDTRDDAPQDTRQDTGDDAPIDTRDDESPDTRDDENQNTRRDAPQGTRDDASKDTRDAESEDTRRDAIHHAHEDAPEDTRDAKGQDTRDAESQHRLDVARQDTRDAESQHRLDVARQDTRGYARQDTSFDARQDMNQDQCAPCICYSHGGLTADCRNRQLVKVPSHLPSNITNLILSGNNIRSLENGSLSYAHLIRLDVSLNGLHYIDLGAFQELRDLECLNLIDNHLSPTNFYRDGLFKHQTKLKVLHINQNVKSRPYDASLNQALGHRPLNDSTYSTSIQQDIHHNNWGHFGREAYPGFAFKYLISLQDLRIDGPQELYFGTGFKLEQLQSLSLGGRLRTCYTRYLRNDTFENVPHLQTLDVSYCLLIDIEISSFQALKNLTSLFVSHNRYLGIKKMAQATYGLQNSSLKILKVNRIGRIMGRSTLLAVEDVKYLKNTKLEALEIEGNRIEIIDKSVMPNLPTSLKRMSIRDNHLTFGLYLMELSVLTDLEWLDASHQDQSSVSFFDDASLHSRHLLQLDSYKNPFTGNVTIYVPPNVTYVDVSHSKMAFEITRFQIGENKIREIDISFNFFSTWTGPIIGLTQLEKVHASNNFCEFLAEGVFSYFPSLNYLDISSNYLGYTLTNDTFSQMPLLEHLDLSNNKISSLPKQIFKNSSRLKFLHLGSNYLMSWNIEIINFNMTVINLSRNAFDEVPSLLRHQVSCMKSSSFHLYFSDNPLKCSCLTLNSLKWMIDNSLRLPDLNNMICLDDSNRQRSLKDIHQIIFDLDKKCTSYLGLSIGVLFLVMLVLRLSITGIVYRFRWKLRYLYYLVRIKHRGYLAAEEDEEGGLQFEFDAFISYADEDRGFVVEDMRRTLEGQRGLRLCIHHRDFLVGEAIAANILNAIRSSRKTVIILSRNFLKSYWCKYEVEMAKMESIYTGRNTLLVVVLEKIPVKDLPPDIVALMRQDSYVEYADDREGQEVFWENLERAVHTA